jgi:heptosyltransferase-1
LRSGSDSAAGARRLGFRILEINPGTVRTILVVKPSSMGDVIHTLPAVHALKQAWPNARITWLVNTEWAPLLAGNPDIERTIAFPRSRFRGWRGWLRIPRWCIRLAEEKPDLVLEFQGLARSALLAKACRPGRILGLSDAREGATLLYDKTVSVGKAEHAVERYLRLVAALNVPIQRPVHFPLPAGVAPASFPISEPYVLLHPFSRGAGKSIEPRLVAALCQELASVPVVLAGRTRESPELPPNCLNLLNRTSIPELIWLVRHAGFTVSVDSGPMHIAAAVSPRLLAIHTWSDPRLVGPYEPEAFIWKAGRIMRVADFCPSEAEAESPFTEAHVKATAAFIRTQLAG